jgi:hypothetical protein
MACPLLRQFQPNEILNNVLDHSEGVEIPGQKPNIPDHIVADAAGPKRLKNVAYPLLQLFQPYQRQNNVLDHSEGGEFPGQKPNITGHMVADTAGPKR